MTAQRLGATATLHAPANADVRLAECICGDWHSIAFHIEQAEADLAKATALLKALGVEPYPGVWCWCGPDSGPDHSPECLQARAFLARLAEQGEGTKWPDSLPDFGDAPVRQRGEAEGYGNEWDHIPLTGDEGKRQP